MWLRSKSARLHEIGVASVAGRRRTPAKSSTRVSIFIAVGRRWRSVSVRHRLHGYDD